VLEAANKKQYGRDEEGFGGGKSSLKLKAGEVQPALHSCMWRAKDSE